MNDPKCPLCGKQAEEEYEGWFCPADDCNTMFIICPVCGDWVCYYSAASHAGCSYELGHCPHVIATYESGPAEVVWHNDKERELFEKWCEETHKQGSTEDDDGDLDWDEEGPEELTEYELLEEYTEDRPDWAMETLSDGNDRHGCSSSLWFLLPAPDAKPDEVV